MSVETFKSKCYEISERRSIPVEFYDDDRKRNDVFEDDGYLHICEGRVRACFDVGDAQSLDAERQNKRTRSILTDLDMTIKIGPRTLIDDEPKTDLCPHCGREL